MCRTPLSPLKVDGQDWIIIVMEEGPSASIESNANSNGRLDRKGKSTCRVQIDCFEERPPLGRDYFFGQSIGRG